MTIYLYFFEYICCNSKIISYLCACNKTIYNTTTKTTMTTDERSKSRGHFLLRLKVVVCTLPCKEEEDRRSTILKVVPSCPCCRQKNKNMEAEEMKSPFEAIRQSECVCTVQSGDFLALTTTDGRAVWYSRINDKLSSETDR